MIFVDWDRFWSKVDKSGDCWLWTAGKRYYGYGSFTVRDESGWSERAAHRLSWEFHYGPIPNGLFVCHNCPGGDNTACVNPNHLFVDDQFGNMRDAAEKGRIQSGDIHWTHRAPECVNRGERHHWASLTDQEVVEIRERYECEWITQRELAQDYRVNQSTISRIVTGLRRRVA